MRDPGRRRRAAVTLELALTIPIFILLVAGTTMIGHALIVRWEMSSGAMVAARSGALTGQRDRGTAQRIVQQHLGSDARACAPLQVIVTQLLLVSGQRTFQVSVDCQFRGAVGSAVLDALRIGAPRMVVTATMPF